MSDTPNNPQRDALAIAAVAPIEPGMVVGLGTGRAATRAVRALADRVAKEGLRIRCIPTSEATNELAHQLDLPLTDLAHADAIDYLFDGADEVDPLLRMIKGRGAAMTREKVLAHCAKARVYLISHEKLVQRLGQRCPLPVETLPFALPAVQRTLGNIGFPARTRLDAASKPITTDNHAHILDIELPERLPEDISLPRLDAMLNNTPGVIGHGLFLLEADRVIIESEDNTLEMRER
ncbi:MAG: ribose-5-phosphate isomerase RpiA [Phycisphaerales bacterium]